MWANESLFFIKQSTFFRYLFSLPDCVARCHACPLLYGHLRMDFSRQCRTGICSKISYCFSWCGRFRVNVHHIWSCLHMHHSGCITYVYRTVFSVCALLVFAELVLLFWHVALQDFLNSDWLSESGAVCIVMTVLCVKCRQSISKMYMDSLMSAHSVDVDCWRKPTFLRLSIDWSVTVCELVAPILSVDVSDLGCLVAEWPTNWDLQLSKVHDARQAFPEILKQQCGWIKCTGNLMINRSMSSYGRANLTD